MRRKIGPHRDGQADVTLTRRQLRNRGVVEGQGTGRRRAVLLLEEDHSGKHDGSCDCGSVGHARNMEIGERIHKAFEDKA